MDPQSSSSASSSMSRRNYGAFLSFRGVDTRHNFISHLYHTLREKGVYTFQDNKELEPGLRRSELFEAIEGSRVAVVTFSENYARSKWCLDELHKIMECKGQGKLTVIPIFYHMSPREVRLHEKDNGEKGCYQIAMEEMEAEHDSETVERWKKALWEGGDLSGIPVVSRQDEGGVVQDIVKRVLKILNRVPLEVAKHPVGIDRHLTAIKPLLLIDPHVDDVRMVGLLGPGGAGKTTLSKAICNDIADRFDDCCFLPNVRETTSKVSNGLAHLQQELLQELLRDKELKVSSVDMGKTLIRERLGEKRVLIILDDVEELNQLDALAGDLNWFGKGSRIILTTRNGHVLTANKVPKYEVNLLERDEARDLFRRHAFGTLDKIDMDCSLIDRFVEYAGKLPLALVVLGAFLRSRSKSAWEGKLKELNESPDEAINNVLKISYDGLDEIRKDIFLDVACLFKGWPINHVPDVYGSAVSLGLEILIERCLITIVDEEIQMHDLLVEMGQSISRNKGHGIPTRIWLYEDLWKILSDERERQAAEEIVEGIVLDHRSENDDPIIKFKALKDFKKLRILIIVKNVVYPEEPLPLPRELRCLEWWGCSAPAIDFYQPSELVCLELMNSEIKQIKATGLKKLKYLDLSGCFLLETLPDLSSCRDLENLKLKNCTSLKRLEKTKATELEKLKFLDLFGCTSLETLPDLSSCRDLENLNLSNCTSLKRLEQTNVTGLEKLNHLDLSWCTSLETLLDLSSCRDLENLNLSNCTSLKRLEQTNVTGLEKLNHLDLSGCTSLETLPNLSSCRDLENLKLMNCTSLKRLEQTNATGLEKIKHLDLSGCSSLETLPDLSVCRDLERLYLRDCTSLTRLEKTNATGLEKLNHLDLSGCTSLETLPDLSNCRDLEGLNLSNCTSLKRLEQTNVTGLEQIKHLDVSGCSSLETLPDLSVCRGLECLYLRDCTSLTRLEKTNATGLEKLNHLDLSGCTSLETLPDLSSCRDLEGLNLSNCTSLKRLEQTNVTGLVKLQFLGLSGCSSLETLPDLSSCRDLDGLNLRDCTSLKRLEQTNVSGLEQIKHLNLSGCSSLETPLDLSVCRDLEVLYLINCTSLKRLEQTNVTGLVKLKILGLSGCSSLETLPDLSSCRELDGLDLSDCTSLKRLEQTNATGLEKIKHLILSGCSSLETLADLSGCRELKTLFLYDCKLKDLEFLDDLTCFETLTTLELSRNVFTHVPASISKFKNLQDLRLDGCDQLVEVPGLPNVPYLNVAKTFGQECFRVELFNSRGLDSGNINRLLSLENVRGSVGAMSVIFPGEEFPHWVKFQSGEYGSCYRVSLPQEMLKDDIFGLALFISFGAVDPSSPDESIRGCRLEVRDNCSYRIIGHYCREEVVGVHSWFVYIPCQSLVQRGGDLAPKLNGLDITLEISSGGGVYEVRRWGMRLLCKREEEDDLIEVLEDGDDDFPEWEFDLHDLWRAKRRLRLRLPILTKRLEVR